MFENENNIDNYNPQILFLFDGKYSYSGEIPQTEYHCHTDMIEISVILSGNVDYLINDKLYNVKKGQALIFNKGIYHQELLNKDTICHELHIGLNNINLFNNKNSINFNGDGILTFIKYKDEFLKCCEEIISEQSSHAHNSHFMLKALIMKLLIIISREINEDEGKTVQSGLSFNSHENKVLVKNITDYFEKNFMNDISLNTISQNMYLSPVYISKIFKELMGDSPINYLINIRLSKAKELLEKENLAIKTVAKMVGYNDPYYFSKHFKKFYGVSPNKFRASYR
ncbi:AraC family transcriptional regulator [Clostridium sp. C8]|uniref:AraC family transcriptional regulator n=1 Tax=Clostridium sp. C8 TaxID=1667357 RepID=UPI00062E73E2|nr:AraC family transcriptional regulator [Clostridium sp. C8]KLE17194.1 AraC family transcriptional regulator [Clostridium sp. C8]